MSPSIRSFFIVFLFITQIGWSAESQKTIRLLTVGNSFADNGVRFLKDLAEAAGHTLILGRANVSACSLERHWTGLQAAEAGDATGQIYPTSPGKPKRSLVDALRSNTWDIITLQQYSRLSEQLDTYRPYAELLRDKIKTYQPSAEVVLYQTWAYRWDDTRYKDGSKPAHMHEAIHNAYAAVSRDLGIRVIPVGDAFNLATSRAEWTYQPDQEFDFANVKDPDVPKQPGSIHTGWRWVTTLQGERKFYMDGNHANIFGSYLAGCVYFEFLYGESPVGNSFIPAEITPEQARSLQEIAHEAVNQTLSLATTSNP